MVSEKVVDKLIKVIADRTQRANTYFLTKLGEDLKQIRELTPSQAHKLVQMLKYGANYQDLLTELSNITKIPKKDIEKIFSNYAKIDHSFYKNLYEYRNKPYIPFDQNLALRRQTTALAEITDKTLKNYTRSTALGYTFKDNKGIVRFHGLRETYEKALDEAVLNLGQGKESFDIAMTRILNEIGQSGLKTLDYESGRTYRLDSMIEMHLRSALNNLHNENQKIIAKEINADGVEVSVHLSPAPDHEDIQGKQFSTKSSSKDGKSEWDKLQDGEEAKTYQGENVQIGHSKTGTYRPISEYNCYHYVFAVILGISTPQYNEKELKDIIDKNNEGFNYNGQHYTNYQGTQLQRTLERKIREQQDVQTLAKESDNFDLEIISQNKMNNLLKTYKDLSEASGLPMNTKKLSTYDYRVAKKRT